MPSPKGGTSVTQSSHRHTQLIDLAIQRMSISRDLARTGPQARILIGQTPCPTTDTRCRPEVEYCHPLRNPGYLKYLTYLPWRLRLKLLLADGPEDSSSLR